MFCPECGSEYRPGFTVCADCEVALVETLSEADDDQDEEVGTPGGSGPGEPARGDLALLGDIANHHDAAAIAQRFELESIPYVLQYGSAMGRLEGKRLFRRRESEWRGLLWVDAGQLRRARILVIEALKELQDEAERAEEAP